MQRYKTAHLALYLAPTVGEEKSESVVLSALRALSITGDEVGQNDAMAVLDFIGRSRDMVGLAARLARRNIELGKPPETPNRLAYGTITSPPPSTSTPPAPTSSSASGFALSSSNSPPGTATQAIPQPSTIGFGSQFASQSSQPTTNTLPPSANPSNSPPATPISVLPTAANAGTLTTSGSTWVPLSSGTANGPGSAMQAMPSTPTSAGPTAALLSTTSPPSVSLSGVLGPSSTTPPASGPISLLPMQGATFTPLHSATLPTCPPRLTLTALADMLSPSLGEENGRRLTTEAAQLKGIHGPTLTQTEALEVLEILASQRGLVGCVARFAKARLLLG